MPEEQKMKQVAARQLQWNRPIRFRKILNSNQGFTLIEILVALVLVAIVLGLALPDSFSTAGNLDQQSDDIERSVRFMSDEAALRNSVIRLHFMLGKSPQEYAIEYGPSSSFVLPPESEIEPTTLTLDEQEKAKKEESSLNLKFNKIKEFQESNKEVEEDIKILGIGHSNSKKLKTTGDVSIYTFPTGEKDEAIIILGNEVKIISLEVNAFNQKIEKKSYNIEAVGNRDIVDVQSELAKEIFDKWEKEN